MYSLYDRILGCFRTAAMGDGMGAPTEAMSYAEIIANYGGRVTRFLDCDKNRIAFGNVPGEITDDASQMFEMIKAVIRCEGELTVDEAGKALVEWSRNWPKYYPRNAGPTAREVILKIANGEDYLSAAKSGGMYQKGTSNGAIMRIAGAGAINPGDLEGALHTGITMTSCSHGTQIAYSAAGAISCAIAEALCEDSDIHKILKAAIYGARKGEEIGMKEARIAAGARVLPLIYRAIDIVYRAEDALQAERLLSDEMGTDSSAIAQACAIAIGLFAANEGDPLQTVIAGANVGGDTDTIACIAGSIAGAFKGDSAIPEDYKQISIAANPGLDLEWAAREYVRIIEERKMNR